MIARTQLAAVEQSGARRSPFPVKAPSNTLLKAWRKLQDTVDNRAVKSDSRRSNACELRGLVRTSGWQ